MLLRQGWKMFGKWLKLWLAILWLAMNAVCSQKLLSSDEPNLSLDEVRERINATQGDEQVAHKLLVLTRFDFPADYRVKISDELITQFDNSEQWSTLSKAYCGKGTGLMHLGKLQAALEQLEKAEEFGEKCKVEDPSVFFKARCNRAACLTMLGEDSKTTVKLLQEALDFAKPYGDQLEVSFVYTLMSHHAEKAGAITFALKYLESAYDIAVRTKKPTLAAQAGTSVIAMLVVNSQIAEAQVWIDKLEPLIESINDPAVKVAFAIHREDVRSGLGDHQTATANLKRIVSEAEAVGNPQSIGNAYLSLAAAENRASNFATALAAADKAIEQLTLLKRSLSLAQEQRARALFGLEKDTEALEVTGDLIEHAEGLPKTRALELRSRILRKLGRFDEAIAHLELCREEEKRRLTDGAREQASFMTAVLEDQQRTAELALFKEQNRAAAVQLELSKAHIIHQTQKADFERLLRNAAIGLSVLIVLGGVLLFRTISHRKTTLAVAAREHQLNIELQESLRRQSAVLELEMEKRRQLEIAVERKHRDETIGKLTGGVAHDFNNLLTVIVQSIELTKLSLSPLSPNVSRLLDASLNAAESGASIVRQLLAYARQQPLSPKPIRVSTWLASTIGMFQQIGGKRVHVEPSAVNCDTTISADSAQLTTSVINLIANARDAIDVNDGKIELRVKTIVLDQKNVHEWVDVKPGEYVMFEVSDNGGGMTPDQLAHACEPFFSTKSPTAGTGLGLSSVLGFVKQSAGDIKLSSTVGKGTTVSFILPTVRSIEAEAVVPQQLTQSRQCVLLVEDQVDVRHVISESLKTMGLDVIEASSADEAVSVLQSANRPHWVLSDVRMPGSVNGIELRNWVLSNYKNTRVILMSGFQDIETQLAPGTAFILKPVRKLDLQNAIEMCQTS
ncbi:MAG: ATP-binding protein [Pirellulaceae bacterium]|nr:ATP-binding protein [Pirellulaceae bacterium]